MLAAALLWPAARRRGLQLERADLPAVSLLGLFGVTLYFALENYGLVFTTASHASLIVATVPLGSAAVEAVRRRRMPTALSIAGMVIAAAGVVVIVRPDGSTARSLLGDLLVLGAMAAWVAYTFLARDVMTRYPALLVTAATMAAGAALLLPLAAVESFLVPLRAPSLGAWAALAYLGLLCSAAAYLLWNLSLPVLGVSVANNLLNVIPLVSVLIGVVALHEPWTASIALGGIVDPRRRDRGRAQQAAAQGLSPDACFTASIRAPLPDGLPNRPAEPTLTSSRGRLHLSEDTSRPRAAPEGRRARSRRPPSARPGEPAALAPRSPSRARAGSLPRPGRPR